MKFVLLATLVAVALAGTKFTLTVSTKNVVHADTPGRIYVSAIEYCTGQEVNLGVMDGRNGNFRRGETNVFHFDTKVNFYKVSCVKVRAGSNDAWMPDTMSIKTDTDPGFRWSNTENIWISTDTAKEGDNGRLEMLWCRSSISKTFAGTNFTLTVSTKNVAWSGTTGPIYASAIDYCTDQEVNLGVLNGNFRQGETNVFHFDTKVNFNKVSCVRVRAGSNDAWMPDTMSIKTDTDPGFKWSNTENIWISTDTAKEGDNGRLEMLWCRSSKE